MKFVRVLAGLLVLAVVILPSGCVNKQELNENSFFGLKATPSVNVMSDEIILTRRSEAYVGSLTASDSYGELMAFAGEILDYKNTAEGATAGFKAPLYGLCTLSGEIIVDPVYDEVIAHNLDNGARILELKIKDKTYLAYSDGSWILEMKKDWSYSGICGNERFAVKRMRTKWQSGKKYSLTYYDFYDYKGKKVFTFDTEISANVNVRFTIGNFSEGLAPINVETYDHTTEDYIPSAFFIDVSGKKVFDGFKTATKFNDGFAVVTFADDMAGVIKPDGEYYIEPTYYGIEYNEDKKLFVCGMGDHYAVLDLNKSEVTNVLCRDGAVELLGKDTLVYKKTINATKKTEYFSVDNNKPLTCAETGQFPDEGSGANGIFYCSYGGVSNIFNENGKTITSVKNFGKIVAFAGDIAVIADTSGNKTMFLNVLTGEKTDWLDFVPTKDVYLNRYVILKSGEMLSLYDTASGEFTFSDCELLEYSLISGNEFLQVAKGEYISLYGVDFVKMMHYAYKQEAIR